MATERVVWWVRVEHRLGEPSKRTLLDVSKRLRQVADEYDVRYRGVDGGTGTASPVIGLLFEVHTKMPAQAVAIADEIGHRVTSGYSAGLYGISIARMDDGNRRNRGPSSEPADFPAIHD